MPLSIKRITSIDDALITAFNALLLDDGQTWDSEQGAKFLANADNALFIAFWDAAAAGFLSAYRLQRFDKLNAEVLIYDVGVHEDYRQRGIGKALIAEVNRWGQEVGADNTWVLANTPNTPAMALYQSMDGEAEPDITMFTYYI
jgi:ribosomal protein S18 acetylase RimI-like enzyme